MVFFCKQKTAYEMRISDLSSDVCSSDLTSEAYQFGTFGCNLVYANLAATLYNACLANTGTNAFDEAFDQTTDSIAGYGQATIKLNRTEESRVGEEGVSSCTFRW